MDISYIKDAIEQAFSKVGFNIAKFAISCPSPLSVIIEKNDDGIKFTFIQNFPTIKTTKFFLSIKTEVEGIFLGKDGGSIKLRHFPDFNFKYSDENTELFGSSNFNLDNIQQEINTKYPDRKRKRIADLALTYANEWANIASQNGIVFSGCKQSNKDKLSDDCQQFVYENIINSKEIEAKSAALAFILLYFILPTIINWVVKRFLDQLFNQQPLNYTA